MDTRNTVWSLRDANNSNKAATRSGPETEPEEEEDEAITRNSSTTCCSEENLLNSPFESFSPSSRCRGASSHGRRRSTTRGQNDGGETSPRVARHRHRHHQRETSKMPTTASHPKSTTAFRQLSDLLWQAQLNSVARRNERERKRVKLVNNGFAALRQKIPSSGKLKADFSSKSSKASKLSKVETLRSAIKYINHLQYLLKECEPNIDSINVEPRRPRVSNSEPYSDNESLNYNTDSSVFSDNNTNIIITGHKEECSTTKHSDESYANEKLSLSGYEPNLNYAQSYHVSSNDSYQNYHCYSTVAQNELFCSW